MIAEERGVSRSKSVLSTIMEIILENEVNNIHIGCIKTTEADFKHLFPSAEIEKQVDAFSNLYYKFNPYYFETHNVVGMLWGLLIVITDEVDDGRIRLCGVKAKDDTKEYVIILKLKKEGNNNGYKE